MLASVTQSEGEKSMLNTATVFSLLLLPFHNAKLSRGGRTMQKMQGGTEKKKKQGHGEESLRCKRDGGLRWAGSAPWAHVGFSELWLRNKVGFEKERAQTGRFSNSSLFQAVPAPCWSWRSNYSSSLVSIHQEFTQCA